MTDGETKLVSLRMNAKLVDAVKAVAESEDRTFTAQIERFVREGITNAGLHPDSFEVDRENRVVRHNSGVEFHYYEYRCEADWLATDVATVANPSLFKGNLSALAAVAKRVAIERGMTYCRLTKRR